MVESMHEGFLIDYVGNKQWIDYNESWKNRDSFCGTKVLSFEGGSEVCRDICN